MSEGDRGTARQRRERAFFDSLAASQEELFWADRTEAAPLRQRWRTRRIARAARLHVATGGHVLDVGCGSGTYTRFLAGWTRATVVGIDLAPGALRRARGRVPTNVRLCASDACRLPFPDSAFDAVVGNAVLHHLPLERTVPELLRVLRPGGCLSFGEPNLANPQVFVTFCIPRLRESAEVSPDEMAFRRGALRRRLEQLGVRNVEVRPFDFLHPMVPARWFTALEILGRALEATPGLRALAGSLLIQGRKAEVDG